ncbi:MAG: PSD1 domain-containing protein [Chitinophagaceae bacterium]|nr:PSD1 domain-containing protein [Chitinophagaceae bacterium]
MPTKTAIILLLTAIIYSCHSRNEKEPTLPETVSYNFHVRPILSDKCFACHGPDANKREANLRLDDPNSAYGHLQENDSLYIIVKGQPDSSELYRRISSEDPDYQMPPPVSHLGILNAQEIATIKKWIAQGAPYEKHWAFQPPQRSPLPVVKQKEWPRQELDYFILENIEQKGLTPNEEADKERLLKRLSLDLTGLPPSESLMQKFMADNSTNAYEKIVDELLSSKTYGEKMALAWLDLARYSDSYGYQDDNIRTQWPWRDWVINAFNRNMPYDRFLTWQLAGDLLPDATKEQKLATAFLRNHKYTEEGGVVPEEYRIEYNLDKVKTFGKGIMGVTIECAQCHDHKYDPFSQKDYYQLFAFFNNSKEAGFEGDVSTSIPAKTPFMPITQNDISKMLSFINHKDTSRLIVSVMEENDTLRKTYVLERGVYDRPTLQVKPSALSSIMPYDTNAYPRNRIGLAKWTTDRKNPLTARVFVNHIWQDIFGRGIVKTSGDMGMQGELPSHPQLLDWLAVDFMENGWNIKRLIRSIVLSSTYRQSTRATQEKLKMDPENAWLSRGPRQRISAEFVRDMVLSTSGLLNNEIGGPSVKPYQPGGLWEGSTSGRGVLATYRQDHGEKLYRRGMYNFIKLTVPPPAMIIFDASNRDQCEVKRSKTNTPLQALVMMNDPLVMEASRVFSERLMSNEKDADKNIRTAFHRIICRQPSANEMNILKDYYDEQLQLFQNKKLDPEEILQQGEYPRTVNADKATTAALMKTINTIYNMEEAITKS